MNLNERISSFTKVILILFSMIYIVLLNGCFKKSEPNSNTAISTNSTQSQTQNIASKTATPTNAAKATSNNKVQYFDVDTISDTFHASDNIAVTWQRSGLIRSEVKVFMDTVLWSSDYPSEDTMSNRTDLDEDGKDEQIEIQSGEDGSMFIWISMNAKEVNLFSLVSQEFLDEIMHMPGGDDGTNIPIYIHAACIDLDGDDIKEIILAVGNDNGALVFSLLKYSGGDFLYKEVGGAKGTEELRYLIITTRNTLFAELYFSDPPSDDPEDMNYVEFAHMDGELTLVRYRNISEYGSSSNGEQSSDDSEAEDSSTQENSSETSKEISDVDIEGTKGLVGQWASHDYGQINGESSSDDELITFIKNGTFTDVIVTSGPLIKGTLKIQGKFKAEGDIILFYDCIESWEPAPGSSTEKQTYKNQAIDDYESEYEFLDDETINMSFRTYEKVYLN